MQPIMSLKEMPPKLFNKKLGH